MGLDITGIGALADAATGIINHFWPDKTEAQKAELAQEMQEVMNAQNLTLAQIAVNAEEAKNTNWFVAGWRPACGWVGSIGLLYASTLEPISRFIATLCGYTGNFPVIDTTITMQVLFCLLGLGSMRTFEKHKDVESKR
jgi:phenylpyruvate tautomerase PptA (4-oxalocrotonate tautomerase family)